MQGKVVDASLADALTLPYGTQVSGAFYTNWDNYQGSINLWLTPEWAGADGLNHYICQWAANGYLAKNSSNNLILSVASGKSMTVACTFVAGTTYHIVARWDSKNTLDGTNYCCISINDVHTFGLTSTWTVETPGSTIYIGSKSDGSSAVAGLIQGMTVLRLPLWDAAYGVDQGDGDVINLAYAAGAGLDVTELLGSWDVCLCVPTDATPGALTSGSTDAWSHPHGSEVLTDAFCQTAYVSSAWEDVGTPVTPTSVAFNGSSTSINCGSEASVDNLADNAMTVECWARANAWGEDIVAGGTLVQKALANATANGWQIRYRTNGYGGIHVVIPCATTTAEVMTGKTTIFIDKKWHHIAFTWDDASSLYPQVWFDGVKITSSYTVSRVGAVIDDSSCNVLIGNNSNGSTTFDGAIGWVRISNNIRYTENFTPPARTSPPASDANTVRLFPMNEGAGTTITDLSTNAQNGTLANGTWLTTRDAATDEPGGRIFFAGYTFGSNS